MKDGNEQFICGRRYSFTDVPKGVRPRVVVEGIKHPGGALDIRFKSLKRAENHIRNMRLERPE